MPIRISKGCRGETRSCSKVPISRSRATDREVRMRLMTVDRMQIRLGTVYHINSRLGLNQLRVSRATGGGGVPGPRSVR